MWTCTFRHLSPFQTWLWIAFENRIQITFLLLKMLSLLQEFLISRKVWFQPEFWTKEFVLCNFMLSIAGTDTAAELSQWRGPSLQWLRFCTVVYFTDKTLDPALLIYERHVNPWARLGTSIMKLVLKKNVLNVWKMGIVIICFSVLKSSCHFSQCVWLVLSVHFVLLEEQIQMVIIFSMWMLYVLLT